MSERMAGLTVARVRAIVTLSKEFGNHPDPLAYVEWYTPFNNTDPDLGMYLIGASTRNHRRRSSIVSCTQILRSCHLIPKFGRASVDPRWHVDNILDQDIKFYVNCYLRHLDFILLRGIKLM